MVCKLGGKRVKTFIIGIILVYILIMLFKIRQSIKNINKYKNKIICIQSKINNSNEEF